MTNRIKNNGINIRIKRKANPCKKSRGLIGPGALIDIYKVYQISISVIRKDFATDFL